MAVRLFAWLARLGLLLALALTLAAPAAESGFRFAWLSDTHIGSVKAEADLRASVQDINAQSNISFVLVSGDVTEYGSLAQLELAKEILAGLKVPSYVIPGNHDTKWSESGATDFGRLWKEDHFAFRRGGFRFLGMHQGPVMKMGDGHWSPQDVRWLEKTLRKTRRGEPIIFVTHYPIDSGIDNWYVVLDLLKRYNTQAVLCGHGHGNRALQFEGIPGVMGRSNLRARNPVGGYNLVEAAGGSLVFHERAPGGETLPAWHSVQLGLHDFQSDTNHYPRPSRAANVHYPAVKERWTMDTGWTIASTPAVSEGLGIVGNASGAVFGFALDTGKPQWQFKTKNAVYSTPAIGGGLVVVASTDGTVYGLKAATGKPAWRFKSARPIVASPAIAAGRVFIGSSEGKFRALDLATGKLAWEYAGLGGFVETRPLIAEDRVIFGAWDEHLYALDASTGQLVWRWTGDRPGTLLSPAACWPVQAGGKIFIAAPDRRLTAIDAPTGRSLWRSGDYEVRETIGVSEDATRLYARAMNNVFYAFSTRATTPETAWTLDARFGYDINSAMMTEKDGVVFYATKNGLLFALDATSGALLWKHQLGACLVNTVLPLPNQRLLATDADGKIFCVEWSAR